MPQATDPSLGINSWLEDELYQQYRFDRKSVDEGWTTMFQHTGQNGSTVPEANGAGGTAVAEPPAASVPPQEPEPPVEEPPQEEPTREDPPEPAPIPQEARQAQPPPPAAE